VSLGFGFSPGNYVFVRFGERVNKDLWYTAPVSRHTASSQFSNRRDEMELPWDAVLYSIRHTALTDLGAAGADAFTIQAVAGHASVTTSERYVHPVPETMMLANDKARCLSKARCKITSGAARIVGSEQVPATISATVPPMGRETVAK
jgi:integrase